MARRRKPKQSDNIKYVLIGAAALIVLFLVFNVAPTGKFTVPATCEDTAGTDLIDDYSTEDTCILTWNAAYTINQPPTITAIDDISLVEGSTLPSITVDATDPNNDDTLTYSITVGISPLETQLLVPAFTLTIDSSSGAITGTLPDISQDTIYRVTVTVTDDATSPGSDSEYFDITVLSDADSDGVADGNDNCPNVANSDQANFDGDTLGDACDDDVDGDGVDETDNADNCPNTTPGASVDEDGCSDSQLDDNADNDNDGVRNGDDLCQGTPSEVLSGTTNDDGVDDNVNSVGCPDTDGDDIYDNLDTVWSLTEDTPDATTEEEVQVISHSLENDGTFSMNLQAATTDTEALTSLTDSLVLVKVTYYDLQTNEEISSTIYTSQVSIGETSTEAFSISVPQTSTAVRYIATVNVWSGMIGTVNWQPYSEKIELRGEFHP